MTHREVQTPLSDEVEVAENKRAAERLTNWKARYDYSLAALRASGQIFDEGQTYTFTQAAKLNYPRDSYLHVKLMGSRYNPNQTEISRAFVSGAHRAAFGSSGWEVHHSPTKGAHNCEWPATLIRRFGLMGIPGTGASISMAEISPANDHVRLDYMLDLLHATIIARVTYQGGHGKTKVPFGSAKTIEFLQLHPEYFRANDQYIGNDHQRVGERLMLPLQYSLEHRFPGDGRSFSIEVSRTAHGVTLYHGSSGYREQHSVEIPFTTPPVDDILDLFEGIPGQLDRQLEETLAWG